MNRFLKILSNLRIGQGTKTFSTWNTLVPWVEGKAKTVLKWILKKKTRSLFASKKKQISCFFMSQDEMDQWIELNNPKEIINNGLSDVYIGFNLF